MIKNVELTKKLSIRKTEFQHFADYKKSINIDIDNYYH